MRRPWLASSLALLIACGGSRVWSGTSPDHRVGYEVFERGGSTCVRVAGLEDGCYDGVALSAFVFSADGRSIAYPALNGGVWFVVHDGRRDPPVEGVGDIVLAPDGRRLAYAAQKEGRWQVVVDGRPGLLVDSLFQGSLTLEPRGRRVAYVAADGDRATVMVDGRPVATHDGVAALRFSPDGKTVAWVARDAGEAAVFLDGAPGRRHDAVTEYAFGPDRAVAYVAQDGGQWWIFGPGVASGPHLRARAVAFDASGAVTFVARGPEGERVFRDGSFGPPFTEVDPPVFGGDRWGYVGRDSLGSTLVIDGDVRRIEGWAGDLVFDEDGQRHAYLVRRADSAFVVHDRGAEAFDVVADGTLHFTSGGCWAALVGRWPDRSLRVIVEGQEAHRPFDWWDFAPAVLTGAERSADGAAAALRAWVAAEAALILDEAEPEPDCTSRI